MQDDPGQERFPILSGRAWALGLDLPAERIVPARRRDVPHPERFLLTPVDPTFPQRVRAGDLIAAGVLGAGTVDDSPIRALRDGGVAALLACSFDARFAELAFDLGLLAVVVDEALSIHTGESLRVDLEGARVANLSSGDHYPIRNASDALLERFRARER